MYKMGTLKIHPEDQEQLKTVKAFLNALKIPFEASEESPYDPSFVAKIKESEREAEQGMLTSIKTEDLWK
jgi:hypothetical protein